MLNSPIFYMSNVILFLKENKFSVISWVATLAVAGGMIFGALAWRHAHAPQQPAALKPTIAPQEEPPQVAMPALLGSDPFASISRVIQLKTNIPADKPRYKPVDYRVSRGDSIFAIAKTYNVEPETVLWANYDVLQDDPHSLKPGQVLSIPPTNGIYYQWKVNDTLQSVAIEFDASADDIINYPGNSIDLTDPKVTSGSWVMVPGGSREFVQWLMPTVGTGNSGTGSSPTNQSACPGGAVGGGGFVWPADSHSLSGNDYWSGHLGVDIAAGEGAPVYAADSGVVTMAQGGYNYGYGNVIQIDHGNGYSTVYAHLSNIGVSPCQSVSAGQWIGAAGNTGNSQGAHLHFEVRQGGGSISPWFVLP
ncbi:MAG TPA: peptidoglycan DD-metalloendopeptidase family protein [Anaerolineales bacterium]|jgi:murein DD-endopeptidase MepM/ murein hydrolase activator NlpD|nr:peptidoglycan DD-metalloendopeptidase family protein [Anaerolineales bacterium]HQX17806.1 peptidoglycan DD-metalloendopeptidase family protein [Anaerolineales bacterium]